MRGQHEIKNGHWSCILKRFRKDFENTLEIPLEATHMAFQSSLRLFVGR